MSGKAPKFASERAMAEAVVSWLRADGWSTFHEVECRGGRADIVAVRQGLVWLIETKLRAGLEVLAQAIEKRRSGAHGVLVAVPAGPAAKLLANISGRLGIGVITVDEVEDFDETTRKFVRVVRAGVFEWPAFYRQATSRELLRGCTREHAAQPAGTTGTKIWTPFKAAVRGAIYELAAAPRHQVLVADLALAESVREYKRGFEASQLRRWLCQAIQETPQFKGPPRPGFFPACQLIGRGKTRAVVLNPTQITEEHRRDYQLDELDRHLLTSREGTL